MRWPIITTPDGNSILVQPNTVVEVKPYPYVMGADPVPNVNAVLERCGWYQPPLLDNDGLPVVINGVAQCGPAVIALSHTYCRETSEEVIAQLGWPRLTDGAGFVISIQPDQIQEVTSYAGANGIQTGIVRWAWYQPVTETGAPLGPVERVVRTVYVRESVALFAATFYGAGR